MGEFSLKSQELQTTDDKPTTTDLLSQSEPESENETVESSDHSADKSDPLDILPDLDRLKTAYLRRQMGKNL